MSIEIHTSAALVPGKNNGYLLDRRLGQSQSRSEISTPRWRERKKERTEK